MPHNNMDDSCYGEEMRCPFCGSSEACKHLLLVTDINFPSAVAGPLSDTFNTRWAHLTETTSDDSHIGAREIFDSLLNEVSTISDAQARGGDNLGPGLSSAYVGFYARSKKRVASVVALYCGD